MSATERLNLGSGGRPLAGYLNVDISPKATGVDLVCNLDRYPWPFADNSADEIVMYQCLEHLEDRNRAMKEIHRILKPGCVVKLSVPHLPGSTPMPTRRTGISSDTAPSSTTAGRTAISISRFRNAR